MKRDGGHSLSGLLNNPAMLSLSGTGVPASIALKVTDHEPRKLHHRIKNGEEMLRKKEERLCLKDG